MKSTNCQLALDWLGQKYYAREKQHEQAHEHDGNGQVTDFRQLSDADFLAQFPAPVDENLVRKALTYIPSHDRKTWMNEIGFALKAAVKANLLSYEVGFEIWDSWSATSKGNYNASEMREKWRTIKPDGRIGIGTLFWLAQQNGFKFKTSSSSNKDALSHLRIARDTLKSYGSGNIIFAQSRFYRWNSTIWRACDDLEIQQQIIRTYEAMSIADRATANTVASVLKLMKSEAFDQNVQFDCSNHCIPCINGNLHFNDVFWELRQHVREDYRLSLIPIEYNPEAKCPRFIQFLEEIFIEDYDKADKIKAIQQFLGYSLTTSCKHEIYIVLIGEGSNGKSVLLYIIENLVGKENMSAVDPTQFGNKFQRAHLRGKLVNAVTELKQGLEIEDSALKSIVSGELCTAEEKYRPPFNFRPYAKCWFGTNHLPHTRDVSYAFFRRALLIEFNRKFDKDTGKDLDLKEKLIQELPGILNFALEGLKSLYSERHFTEPVSSVAAEASWRLDADQVMQFVDECCKTGQGMCIKASELYSHYVEWAKKSGISKIFSKNNFGRRLRAMGIKGKDGTNGIRLYEGVEIDYAKSGA